MRITGGIYKNRKIICPHGVIRPAMDRMRESLFAILGNLSGCSFLDLFSGSGVIGIEAASREADPVLLVEKDIRKKHVILNNINFVKSNIKLYIIPVERFISVYKGSFDIIFLDPPFNKSGKTELILNINKNKLLNSSGCLIIHIPKKENIPASIGNFSLTDRRTYGGSILLFYEPIKEETTIE